MSPSTRRVAAAFPLIVAALIAPSADQAAESAEHGRCSSCHVGERLATRGAGQQCGSCHGDVVSAEAKFRSPGIALVANATPTAHSDCASCHAPHPNGLPFQMKIGPADAAPTEPADLDHVTRVCQACHGEIALSRGPRGHFIRHPVGLRLARGRRSAAARLNLPLVDVANTADPSDDVLSCITCHDVHGGAGSHRLRWSAGSESATCRGCHALDQPPSLLSARVVARDPTE